MTVIKFPRDYQEPPPEPEPQLELWPDLPALEPLDKHEQLRQVIAEIADDIAGAVAHLRTLNITGVFTHLCVARNRLARLDDFVGEVTL
jgi:hypothetical protein